MYGNRLSLLIVVPLLFSAAACSDPSEQPNDTTSDDTDSAVPDSDTVDSAGLDSAEHDSQEPDLQRPDLAHRPPTEPGPYGVGYRQATWTYTPIGYASERELDVAIWYPTLAVTGDEAAYQLIASRPGVLAEPEPAGGDPLPVMVFSHGHRGFPEQSYFLTEFFASHGWLVIAPSHPGNTFFDRADPPADMFLLQPQDVSAALDTILALSEDDPLSGRVSADVLVAGHGFGAYAALVAGGAEFPVDAFRVRCANERHTEVDFQIRDQVCPSLTPDTVTLMKLGMGDDRIDAVLALAPEGARFFGRAGPARIDVPGMIMTADLDESNTDQSEGDPIWGALDEPFDRRVRLEGAGHFTFSNLCDAAPAVFDGDGCGDEFIDSVEAHQTISAYGLAFGRAILGADHEQGLALVGGLNRPRVTLEAHQDAACSVDPVADDVLDAYGGWNDLSFDATGFFRVEQDDDRFWLVTPDGHAFFSTGVTSVGPSGTAVGETGERPYRDNVLEIHGSVETWADVTRERLSDWGFNSLGAWSDWRTVSGVPYTIKLGMSGSDWLEGDIPDYWSESWEAHIAQRAAQLEATKDDPLLIGVFLDNEMRWGADHRITSNLFDSYLFMDRDQPGKQRLVGVLSARYAEDIDAFNLVWATDLGSFDDLLDVTDLPNAAPGQYPEREADVSEFLLDLASRFFSRTSQAIREVDSNHLNLGVRFVSQLTPSEVIAAAGPWVDVLSVNFYEVEPIVFDSALILSGSVDPRPWLAIYHDLSRRPVLIGEFGFRAADSGLPNTWPPIYPTLDTQEERADGLERYALNVFNRDYVVGYHWFTWSDQPAEGRFDGENNNFGLVNIEDTPYEVVTSRARSLHDRMYPCLASGFQP